MRTPPPRPKGPVDPRHRRFGETWILDQLAFIGWSRELADGQYDAVMRGAADMLDRAVAAGARFERSPEGARLFDPVEVDNHLSWLAASGEDQAWMDRVILTNNTIAAGGRAAPAVAERDYNVTLRRAFDLSGFAPGAAIRLRAPQPLRCEYHDVVSITPEPGRVETTVSEGRLEARLPGGGDKGFRIGAEVKLRARAPGPDPDAGRLDEQQAQAHLRPSEGLIQVTPRVVDLAQHLAGDASPVEAVTNFIAFLSEGFRYNLLRYDEVTTTAAPDWVLEHRVHDCQLCAATLISLCRARGIPARLVTGHFLYELSPTNHNWAEIWIDGLGWRPYDVLHLDRDNPASGAGGAWVTDFAARGDFRLANQRLPLSFTGPMSVRIPSPWQVFQTAIPGGVAITYFDVATGAQIYRDEVVVKRLV